MNMLSDIVTAFITSTVVSSLIFFILKTWLEERIKHHFEVELQKQRHQYEIDLEKVRADMIIKADHTHEVAGRQLLAYPKIVELIYRVRNMARDITKNKDVSQTLCDELRARSKELEDDLYAYRMDLERDQVFLPVHSFKNACVAFNQMIADYRHCLDGKDAEQAARIAIQLDSLYENIETNHRPIIDRLSKIIP